MRLSGACRRVGRMEGAVSVLVQQERLADNLCLWKELCQGYARGRAVLVDREGFGDEQECI